jgi:hypothetical protein
VALDKQNVPNVMIKDAPSIGDHLTFELSKPITDGYIDLLSDRIELDDSTIRDTIAGADIG